MATPATLLAPSTITARPAEAPAPAVAWYRTTWAVGAAGGIALWTAFPPLEWWPLAWVAPVIWLLLIRRRELGGRRPYWALWLAGFVYFGMMFYWIALAHWAAYFGWAALSAYLACYLPAFIGLSRVAVHRLRVPLILAAPTVWTALELIRAYLFTGFLMGALGHTQYGWLELIQISDVFGAYGVSFLVMFVAACLARMLPVEGHGVAWWPVVPAAATLAATLGYGYQKVSEDHARSAPTPRIALVQGSFDARFSVSMDEFRALKRQIYQQHMELSARAVETHRDVDLVVWPESMYRAPLIEFEDLQKVPEDMDADVPDRMRQLVLETATELATPMLLAVDRIVVRPEGRKYFNSSAYVAFDRQSRTAEIRGRYDKMHLVPFGEYVPLGHYFPWLYKLTPLSGGLTPSERPEAFEVGRNGAYRVSPAICFESVVPHLIRRQMRELAKRGETPDVFITQTNDGWFWGSAALDMHLICGVFRAIECRRPFLTAANTGISASIDARGRIIARAGKRVSDVIVADVTLVNWESPYVQWGDWLAWACLIATGLVAAIGLVCRWRGQ
jgi:apolipoprotein N-acyltransferase